MRVLDALVSQDFCRVADSERSDGNRVRLLRDGPEAFPAWLAAIAGADRDVHLENYVLQEDDVGRQFADALLAASDRGVRVRVIYDWMGCLRRTSRRFWRQLSDGGVEVRRYNPPSLRSPLGWVSRDHRKVLCVDGRLAFTGGLCIGHDWVGDPARGVPPWRDTAIEIEGPAVAQIDAAFADSWASIGGGPEQEESPISVGGTRPPPIGGGVGVSVIAGRPHGGGLYRLEQLIAEVAEQSLWLTDGYFVATTAYVRALADAARAGVDVRLLVPGSSNWPVVGALSKLAYRPLLAAGVRVFEWDGPMVHAKTAVADGRLTRIGSSNSNLASWISNRELDVTVIDDVLAGQMREMYERDLSHSTEVRLETGARTLARSNGPPTDAALGRLFSGAIGLGHTLGASLSQDRRLGSSDSAVLLGGGLLLLATGLLAMLAPRWVAYPIGAVALWFAAGLLLHAWRLRRAGRSRP